MTMRRSGAAGMRRPHGSGATARSAPITMVIGALLAVAPVVVCLAGCSALEEPATPASPAADALMSPAAGLETISWSEAVDSVGQRLRVEGVVAGFRRRGDAVELSLGLPAPEPQRFVVIVPGKVAERFTVPPQELEGRLVRVTGTIVKSGDHTAIRIKRPAELRLVQ
ncbi:MAG TPA: hypothetical protein PLT83_04225 [Thermoleophilia bacterium]|nr:hypothetical protein [Thermoleophilia bacterium]